MTLLPPPSLTPWNGQLRECQLNGIPFPTEHVRMNFSQQISEHKYPNVSGANVESLGRNSITFEVRAIFLTGTFRSPTETWSNLFPQTFQQVMRTLNDPLNEEIPFQHPTLGKFRVKVVHGTTETVFSTRNGQIIDFELIESGNNDVKGNQQNVLGNDEVGQAVQSAGGLDARLAQYQTANPAAGLPNISFSSLLATAIAPVQATTVAIGTAFATASNAIAQVNIARQQITSLADPSTSYMLIEMESIASALNDQRTNNVGLNIYQVRTVMTLNQVLIKVQNFNKKLNIEKLISLNPQLSVTTALQPNTIVYWQ